MSSIMLLNPETERCWRCRRPVHHGSAHCGGLGGSSQSVGKTARSLAILGTGVQARSHLDALSRVHGWQVTSGVQ
jgi:hypothetical protein